jgi:hypothetical protein
MRELTLEEMAMVTGGMDETVITAPKKQPNHGGDSFFMPGNSGGLSAQDLANLHQDGIAKISYDDKQSSEHDLFERLPGETQAQYDQRFGVMAVTAFVKTLGLAIPDYNRMLHGATASYNKGGFAEMMSYFKNEFQNYKTANINMYSITMAVAYFSYYYADNYDLNSYNKAVSSEYSRWFNVYNPYDEN